MHCHLLPLFASVTLLQLEGLLLIRISASRHCETLARLELPVMINFTRWKYLPKCALISFLSLWRSLMCTGTLIPYRLPY
jgi:hypothetical protein